MCPAECSVHLQLSPFPVACPFLLLESNPHGDRFALLGRQRRGRSEGRGRGPPAATGSCRVQLPLPVRVAPSACGGLRPQTPFRLRAGGVAEGPC